MLAPERQTCSTRTSIFEAANGLQIPLRPRRSRPSRPAAPSVRDVITSGVTTGYVLGSALIALVMLSLLVIDTLL